MDPKHQERSTEDRIVFMLLGLLVLVVELTRWLISGP